MISPIKTEYKGIVYDSKSEAIFARCLDLAGVPFNYHVEYAGHEWDFLLWEPLYTPPLRIGVKDYAAPIQKYRTVLVELKPSRPTETYLKNLRDRVWAEAALPVDVCYVFVGGPWSKRSENKNATYEKALIRKGGPHLPGRDRQARFMDLWLPDFTITKKQLESAASYRFDLKYA